MPTRFGSAQWKGDLGQGSGTFTVGKAGYQAPYSAGSRFEEAGGSNPEELIAAAHASCYSMALSFMLSLDGHTPISVDTTAQVTIEKVGDGFAITKIKLMTKGVVPGIDASMFQDYAQKAKVGCPVSKALSAVPSIELEATLG